MPPPPTHASAPRGGSSMPACVFARRRGHTALSSGTGRAHAHAQAHTARTPAAGQQRWTSTAASSEAPAASVSSASAARKHQRHQLEQRHGMQARLPTPTLCIEYLCYHYAVVLALFNAITLCFKQKDDFVYNPTILQTQCFQCFAPCLL